jgi:hypothetical protein
MQVSLSSLEGALERRASWGLFRPIDKLKFRVFKPLLLDVIFHGCKIVDIQREFLDAFAR